MSKLKTLPDYPAIKKLAAALHQLDASRHGAAIMIGAGFSRCAAQHVTAEKKVPLWNEFTQKLIADMAGTDTTFSDPLRIAEEYRAFFGQAALNDRIRFEIDNDSWRPGELYTSLLKLPWSDVLTTNWDTILECAAKEIHSPCYTTVSMPSDLAWAPPPRIVKLHGTIGVTETLIAAEEDYRSYPTKFAPFVNFARQVFIENELCLLGFSGDDPNFLQWAGWVRDNLSDHARKIYLVGALNLSAARRKRLEAINITPIDLSAAVSDIDDQDHKHQMTTKLFLEALITEGQSKSSKHKWKNRWHFPQLSSEDYSRQFKEPAFAATILKNQISLLETERESYPGWLICPPELLSRMRIDSSLTITKNIAALEKDDRTKLLYEIAWRKRMSFTYISYPLAELLFQVADPNDLESAISKRQKLEIALILLHNCRQWEEDNSNTGDTIEKFASSLVDILEKHAESLPDGAAELAYYHALVARDTLDYSALETYVEKIKGEDPVWNLRRAGLLMELGRDDESERLIVDTHRELRERYRYAPDSIPLLSRLAWSHWLLERISKFNSQKTLEALPIQVDEWKCDPWTWIEHIRGMAVQQKDNLFESKNTVEPLFQQGHYRNKSDDRYRHDLSLCLEFDGLSRTIGIPLYARGGDIDINLLAGVAENLALYGSIAVEFQRYILSIRSASSETSTSIKRVFSRIGIAQTSQAIADKLIALLFRSVEYWRAKCKNSGSNQSKHAISILRVSIEVLARLTVRASPEKAKEIFRLGISLGHQKELHHRWLFDVLTSIVTYPLQSIPHIEQSVLLKEALGYPLQNEVSNHNFPRFPNPVIRYIDSRESSPEFTNLVNKLIDSVKPDGSTSTTSALLRLLPLTEKEGFLTGDENEKLATAIWGRTPDYQTLPETGLFPHVLLLLPSKNPHEVKRLIQRSLYENTDQVLATIPTELRTFPSQEIEEVVALFGSIANAAVNKSLQLFPAQEQAIKIFDEVITWRPEIPNEDEGFTGNSLRSAVESIGNALSYAIVPSIPSQERNAARFEKLQAFCEEIDGAISAVPALAYFTSPNEEVSSKISKHIGKRLRGNQARSVGYAAIALKNWMRHSVEEKTPHPESLISFLLDLIDARRATDLQYLLDATVDAIKMGLLSEKQRADLEEAVCETFELMSYENIDSWGQEAISASSIRESCVKLAAMLVQHRADSINLQKLIQDAKEDALPEVRFALHPDIRH